MMNSSFHFVFQEINTDPKKASSLRAADYKSHHQRFEDLSEIGERIDEDKLSLSLCSTGFQPCLKSGPNENDVSLELTLA